MTASTMDTERPSATSTSWMAPRTNTASSLVTVIDMPSGSVCWMFGDGGRDAVGDVQGVRLRLRG